MRATTRHAHITADGTTELVSSDKFGRLYRVLVTDAGTAGTVTLEDQAGNDIAIIDVTTVGEYTFDLDLRVGGLQAVAAGFTGAPSVTVIFEGG